MILIAHRGDPRHAPENTLVSFRQAAARGAKAVEMDLRRTRDGDWIVFHDRFSSRPAFAPGGKEPVPTLAETLSFCRSRQLEAYLDIKEPAGELSLSRVLRLSGWLRRTKLMAGELESLRRWRRLFPQQPLFWVTGYKTRITPRRITQASRLRLTGFVSYKLNVTKTAVEQAHRAGLKVFVWTVRTASGLRRYARMGVDGIMSELWPPPRSI